MPIHASNVMLVHKGKPTRVGYKIRRDGTKVRVAKRRGRRGDLMSDDSNSTGSVATVERTVPRLKPKYHDEIKAKLKQQLGLGNVMQVPALEKIVINMGVGRATQQPSLLEGAVADLTPITGQKPIITKAKQVDRRVQAPRGPVDRHQGDAARRPHVGVPRPADRRRHPPHPRLPRPAGRLAWDGRGNYTFGLNDQTVFPEIDYDKIDVPRGMDITIVTTATNDAAGKALLDAFGFPFRQADDPQRPRAEAAPQPRWPGPRQEEEVGSEMAKKALINKAAAKPKFKVRGYTRCRRCGRARSVFRKFGLCRVCLRELAHAGEIPGLTKSSW